jgi:cytochrome P450
MFIIAFDLNRLTTPHQRNDAMSASLADLQSRIDGSALYRELRAERPVYLDKDIGMVIVSRYDDIKEVFRQPNLFSSALAMFHTYNHDTVVRETMTKHGYGPFKEVLPMTDPPIHMRVRTLVTTAFSPTLIKSLRPGIVSLIDEIFDSFIDEVEVVSQLGVTLPVTIICDLLSLPRSRADDVKRWTRAYTACAGNRIKSDEEAVQVGLDQAEMQNCFMGKYKEYRNHPQDNLLTALMNARAGDFEPLNEEELLAIAAAIMVAGHETTTVAITSIFKYLASVPGELDRLRNAEDRDTAYEQFCDEALRLVPPVKMHPRVATEDTTVGGVPIPKMTPLMVITASANLDDAFFENPERFCPGRKNGARHMSFGAGIHSCLGMQLAKMELSCVVAAIVERMDNLRLATPNIPLSDYEPVVMELSYQLRKLDVLFDKR